MIAAGSVNGAARWSASRRAPAAVAVRSIVASKLPLRSPASVVVSSRLRRVAASICISEPGATRRLSMGEARRHMRFNRRLEMKSELVVELSIDGGPGDQRTDSAQQIRQHRRTLHEVEHLV